jgi:hypothetical protein
MDLPRIRLHDLRHTHASILLKAGVPVKVVSERLGHSSPAFTMQVYQHVLPGMQADAAAAFGELVLAAVAANQQKWFARVTIGLPSFRWNPRRPDTPLLFHAYTFLTCGRSSPLQVRT